MPSGRKKCICQICTCGRHICPHRKKEQLIIGSDQQSAKAVNAASRGEGRKQRKQWESRSEKKTVSLSSSDQLNTTFIIDDSTNLVTAVTVENKGNRQTSSVQNGAKWSGKQIPKTLPIKRPDNLRQEGESDFTTTHKQDFIEKSTSLQTIDSSNTSSVAVQEESWNKRQIPKTQKIKKADTLAFSGPLSMETTHKAEFSESTFKSKTSSQEGSLVKETYQRPRTSLKVGGEFQSDSSYQSAFTAKQSESGYIVKKGTSTSNLKSEGEMTFDQTSMDYNSMSTHASRASENGGDIVALKPKIARPESEIKIPSVPLSDETTLVSDFKRWNVERPTRHKPSDTLQLGGPEEEDSMSRRIDGKSSLETSHMETSTSDYKNWQVSRPVVSKPQNNLKSEGSFHFNTTHDSDYSSRRDTITVSKGNSLLEPLTERTETESVGPSSQDERVVTLPDTEQTVSHVEVDSSRSVQINDVATHIQEADVKEAVVVDSTDAQIRDTSNTAVGIEHKEHEDHGITTQAEEQEHYMSWDEIRPKPIRPHSNLRQEGGMEFNTTNRSEFVTRSMERVKGVRPKTSTKLFDGDFDATTMNQVMFSHDQGEKVHPIRPKSNLHVEGGDFIDETTSTREFQQWQISKPSPIVPKSSLVQEGSMDFTTTNQTDFEEKRPEKVFPIRPTTTNQMSGDIDLTTTNRVMHGEFPIERVKKIVPQSNLRMNSGAFVAETTNKTQFQEWDIDRPKPIRPVGNLTQEGSMDFTTMNKLEFEEKTMEKVSQFRPQTSSKITGDFDGVTTNQVMFGLYQSERPQMVKPKGNLEVEKGKFATDTTNLSEYQQWPQQSERPHIVKPKGNLQVEKGKFATDTTNLSEFQQWTHQSERPQIVKPKGNLQVETGKFATDTTNHSEFQQWNQQSERPQIVKPKGNLEVEKGKFATDTTNLSEYQQWPQQSERPKIVKPKGNLQVEKGKFATDTTNLSEFQQRQQQSERPQIVKPKGNLEVEKGKFATDTTNLSEYQQWPQQSERSQIVKPKGNLQVEKGKFATDTTNHSEFQQWHQQSERPQIVKPKGNLEVEKGKFATDTTTTSEYQQWPQQSERPQIVKPKGNLEVEKGKFATDTTTLSEYQQWPQQSERPQIVKPKGNLEVEKGKFATDTTNLSEFQQWQHQSERPQIVKPKGNLQVEKGKFATDTTNLTEFQQWELTKPEVVTPRNNLSQEGDIDFTTTSQIQYGAKQIERVSEIRPKTNPKITGEFDGTTTNQVMFQDSPREKLQVIRPQNNLQLEEGNFTSETTNNTEFKQWQYSKPSLIKPHSSMRQEGDMDFTTTNDREFMGKISEKVSPIRPTTTTKISGEFESITTNQAMFQNNPIERVRGKRPPTNVHLEKGKFENETTARREFQQWEINRPEPIKPVGNLIQEGEMDFTTSNKTDFEAKPITKVETIRPHTTSPVTGDFDGTTTNDVMFQGKTAEKVHDIRPKDNLRVDSGQFNSETTTSKAFEGKTGAKPVPIRPKSNLTQEGEFDFITSNQMQFEEKAISKVTQIRPKTLTKAEGGKFYSTTTNQAMFQAPTMTTAREIKPTDNLHLDGGEFQNKTTSSDEYQQWKVQKPTSFQLASTLKQEGDMQFETTNTTEFQHRGFDRVQPIRPKTTNKIEGDFEATTTNQVMFQGHEKAERMKPIRHQNNLQLEKGKFSNETTNNREFRQWVKMESKDTERSKKPQAAGVPSLKPMSPKKKETQNDTEKSIEVNVKGTRILDKESAHDLNGKETGLSTVVSKTVVIEDKSMQNGIVANANQNKDVTHSLESSSVEKSGQTIVQGNGIHTQSLQRIEVDGGAQKSTRVSTVMADYGTKQVTKVKSIIPSGTLTNSGDMTFTTTSKTDYAQLENSQYKQKSRYSRSEETIGGILSPVKTNSAQQNTQVKQKSRVSRSDEKIGGGIPGSPGRTDSEYRAWKLQQSEIIRKSDSRNESQILLQSDDSQVRGVKTGHASPTSPPKTPVSKPLKRFKPADNLKIESVPFEASTTNKTEFKKWETRRSSSKKRDESLKQEGNMQFDTTSNDYSMSMAYQASRESTKAKSKADQRGSLGQSGSMDFHTTANSSYTGNFAASKSKMIRPRSSLKLGGEESSAANDSISSTRSNPETVSRDFQDLTSTSRASYVGHATSRRTRSNRPSTSQKVGQGAFEGQTTSTSSFTAHQQQQVVKSRAIRHENHNILNAESGFSGSTTYRNSFEATKGHHCPVLDLQGGGSGFTFNEEKNGHIYYAPRVQG